jgi:hypothetical protein
MFLFLISPSSPLNFKKFSTLQERILMSFRNGLHKWLMQLSKLFLETPVTVAKQSKALIVFARADAGTVGSNPTHAMDVYCLCCVFILLCLYTSRGLATSWSPVQGVLPAVLDLVTEVKRKVSWRRPRPELDCRTKGKKNLETLIVTQLLKKFPVLYETVF